MSGDDDFAAWFRLLETPGLGREGVRRLIAACGTPEAVLATPYATLCALVGQTRADALQQPPPAFEPRWAAAQRWLAGGDDRHVLTLAHPAWPPLLLQSPDAPLLLYVQGDTACLSAASVAVVGSRRPSVQGADNARHFAASLGAQGWVIVSGLAQGIDAAAHEGALGAGAKTIAVMGTGPDLTYPARHRALAHRIAAQGALVSEFAPGTPPLPEHFPLRNRIIAGLTQGTLVVEAALKSGSLITARLANEAGRDVWAVPGSIHAAQSQGCHALIKQGAKLVETPDDVLEELRAPNAPSQSRLALDGDDEVAPADPLLQALGDDPVTLDALLARTGWPTSELSARLLELELDGRVSRLPGGLFQRRHSA
ncbi:MAG: DNA-processing protein DprA [Rubrivivax sp.]|nr:DNA-processing protein DprA [Rubrivivax sp.]